MKYYRGYNYVVAESFTVQTDIKGYTVWDKLTHLRKDGQLTILMWYPWDGNSGIGLTTKNAMKASCVHDVLCDYINMGWLPSSMQPMVDKEYYNIAVGKNMPAWLAKTILVAITWYMAGKGAKRYTRKVLED